MPATPKRAGRRPRAREGARWPAQVLAANLRGFRRVRDMSQDELAERMTILGHGWMRATVSEVERGGRKVSIDELLSLALVLSATIGDLLDPLGVERRFTDATKRLDMEVEALPPRMASAWVRGALILALTRRGEQGPWRVQLEGAAQLPDPEEELQEAAKAARAELEERVYGS